MNTNCKNTASLFNKEKEAMRARYLRVIVNENMRKLDDMRYIKTMTTGTPDNPPRKLLLRRRIVE